MGNQVCSILLPMNRSALADRPRVPLALQTPHFDIERKILCGLLHALREPSPFVSPLFSP